jgi:hypothetical protein
MRHMLGAPFIALQSTLYMHTLMRFDVISLEHRYAAVPDSDTALGLSIPSGECLKAESKCHRLLLNAFYSQSIVQSGYRELNILQHIR